MSNATSTTRRSRRQPRVQQAISDAAISREVDSWFQSQLRTLTPRNRGNMDSYVPEALPLMDDQFVHDLTSDDEFVGDQGNGTETRSPWNVFSESQPAAEPDEDPTGVNEYDAFAPNWRHEDGGMFRAIGIRLDMDHFLPIWKGPRIQRFTFVNGRPERIPDPVPTAAERAGLAGPADSDVVKAAQRAAYTQTKATSKVA